VASHPRRVGQTQLHRRAWPERIVLRRPGADGPAARPASVGPGWRTVRLRQDLLLRPVPDAAAAPKALDRCVPDSDSPICSNNAWPKIPRKRPAGFCRGLLDRTGCRPPPGPNQPTSANPYGGSTLFPGITRPPAPPKSRKLRTTTGPARRTSRRRGAAGMCRVPRSGGSTGQHRRYVTVVTFSARRQPHSVRRRGSTRCRLLGRGQRPRNFGACPDHKNTRLLRGVIRPRAGPARSAATHRHKRCGCGT